MTRSAALTLIAAAAAAFGLANPPAPAGGLWILRHGEDAGPDRQLTENGRRQVRAAAAALARVEGLKILTSPRDRCRQSAEVVRELSPGALVEVADWLDADAPLPADWRQRLPPGPVLLVTHQPVIAQILREGGGPLPSIPPAFLRQLDPPAAAPTPSPPSADPSAPPAR